MAADDADRPRTRGGGPSADLVRGLRPAAHEPAFELTPRDARQTDTSLTGTSDLIWRRIRLDEAANFELIPQGLTLTTHGRQRRRRQPLSRASRAGSRALTPSRGTHQSSVRGSLAPSAEGLTPAVVS